MHKVCSIALLSLLLLSSIAIVRGDDLEEPRSGSSSGGSRGRAEDYDPEEFVGMESLNQRVQQQHVQEVAKSLEKDMVVMPPTRDNWYLEIAYITFIASYLVCFWFGKKSNEQIARSWFAAVDDVISRNFARMGAGLTPPAEKGKSAPYENMVAGTGLIKESHSVYKLKASGRVNCVGVQVTLDLKKRQEVISNYIIEPLMNTVDTMTVEVLMDNKMANFIFVLLTKKQEKKYKKSARDLETVPVSNYSPEELDDTLVVISESDDIVKDMLPHSALSFFNGNSNFIRMHFSDQNMHSDEYPKSLQFVFKLPSVSDMNKVKEMLEVSLDYIDLVATTELSKMAKQKCEKNRVKLMEAALKETYQQRQELLQQKKLEKLQNEKKAVEAMNPEQQRKWEEKQAKKEQKRKMKAGFKVIKS